jgi:hypothetical protein
MRIGYSLDALRHEDAGKVLGAVDTIEIALETEGLRAALTLIARAVLGRAPTADELAADMTDAAGRQLAHEGVRPPRTLPELHRAARNRVRKRLREDGLLHGDAQLDDATIQREVERLAAADLARELAEIRKAARL